MGQFHGFTSLYSNMQMLYLAIICEEEKAGGGGGGGGEGEREVEREKREGMQDRKIKREEGAKEIDK